MYDTRNLEINLEKHAEFIPTLSFPEYVYKELGNSHSFFNRSSCVIGNKNGSNSWT